MHCIRCHFLANLLTFSKRPFCITCWYYSLYSGFSCQNVWILITQSLNKIITVYLTQAICTYLLARSMICRLTELQYNQTCKCIHVTFGVHFDEYGWYVLCLSCDVVVPIVCYITNGRSEFCIRCALSIDQFNEFRHKIRAKYRKTVQTGHTT